MCAESFCHHAEIAMRFDLPPRQRLRQIRDDDAQKGLRLIQFPVTLRLPVGPIVTSAPVSTVIM